MHSDNQNDRFNSSRSSNAVHHRGRGFAEATNPQPRPPNYYYEQDRRMYENRQAAEAARRGAQGSNNDVPRNQSYQGDRRRSDQYEQRQSNSHNQGHGGSSGRPQQPRFSMGEQRRDSYDGRNQGYGGYTGRQQQQQRSSMEESRRDSYDRPNQGYGGYNGRQQQQRSSMRESHRDSYDGPSHGRHGGDQSRYNDRSHQNHHRHDDQLNRSNGRQENYGQNRNGNGGQRYDDRDEQYDDRRHVQNNRPYHQQHREQVQENRPYRHQHRENHQDDYDDEHRRAPNTSRRYQRAPANWHPEDRDLQKVIGEGARGAQRLKAAEDRLLEVLHLNDPPMVETWEDLQLHPTLLENIRDLGYTQPRESQKKIIPLLLDGHDVVAQCETGAGKTAAFAIPIIQKIMMMDPDFLNTSKMDAIPLAVVLAPTRELASQLFDQFRALAKNTGVSVVLVHGEMDKNETARRMKLDGCQVLVGTCGRVQDHITKRDVCVQSLKMLILDEAENMLQADEHSASPLEMFIEIPQMQKVLRQLQIVVTSATLASSTHELSKAILKPAEGNDQPVTVKLIDEKINGRVALQFVRATGLRDKKDRFIEIVTAANADMTAAKQIVFVNRRDQCHQVAKLLSENGIVAEILSGERPQNERDQVVKDFRDGEFDVLVTTDVMARGIDLNNLTRVIMMDLPPGNFEESSHTFTHRIGRVGRLTPGKAYIIIDVNDEAAKKNIDAVMDIVDNKNGIFVPEWLQEFVLEAKQSQQETPEREVTIPSVASTAPAKITKSETSPSTSTDPGTSKMEWPVVKMEMSEDELHALRAAMEGSNL